MNFKKLESGRSMVEMLGVLAIIGVLSVGGIAGYSLSMRRHRANQIVDIASKYALVAYGRCQQQILDGAAASVTECSSAISFSAAGVGQLPAGISTDSHINDGMSAWFFKDEKTGSDIVGVLMSFDDLKLCQTFVSIAGTGYNSEAACTEHGTVSIHIKQN
jgi:type II secretory pathway pseudopilin PulG